MIGKEGLLKQQREDKFVAISGMMGIGKTTLSRILNAWGPDIFFQFQEPEVTNPYLPGQYEAVERGEYRPEVYRCQDLFLTYKLDNLLNIRIAALRLGDDQQLWLDRTIYEDAEIFAQGLYDRGLIIEEEWSRYVDSYNAALVNAPKPRLLYNLEAFAETCRLRAEHDPVRNAVPPDLTYYLDLNDRYQTWVENFISIQLQFPENNRTRVERINTNDINLHELKGQNQVLEYIVESLVDEGLLNSEIPALPDRVLVPYEGIS